MFHYFLLNVITEIKLLMIFWFITVLIFWKNYQLVAPVLKARCPCPDSEGPTSSACWRVLQRFSARLFFLFYFLCRSCFPGRSGVGMGGEGGGVFHGAAEGQRSSESGNPAWSEQLKAFVSTPVSHLCLDAGPIPERRPPALPEAGRPGEVPLLRPGHVWPGVLHGSVRDRGSDHEGQSECFLVPSPADICISAAASFAFDHV